MSKARSDKEPQLVRGVIKTVVGMVVTSPRELIKLAAHAGDQLLKGDTSAALTDTYSYFVNKGKIDPKYFDSRQFADLAPEFGRIEKESYGIEKLDTLRRMFINLAKDNGVNSHKKYLLDIALDMSEPEIKVLLADITLANKVGNQEEAAKLRRSDMWLATIAELSGLKHNQLVEAAEKELVEKGLLTGWIHNDHSGNDFHAGRGRLTSMGKELCSLMELEDDPIQAP